MKALVVSIIVFSFFVTGCRSAPASFDELDDIDAKDGINAKEARVLADVYFLTYSGCRDGGVIGIIEEGEYWKAETAVGTAAKPYHPIYIEKDTGMINSDMGPVVLKGKRGLFVVEWD